MLKRIRKIIIASLAVAILFSSLTKLRSFADEASDIEFDNKTVTVGYYQNENFQEGAFEGGVKSGYSYEYLQKVASYTGWKYDYIYGSWTDIYDAFINGDIDLLAGLGYSESRLSDMYYPDYPMGYESYYIYANSADDSITTDASTLNGKSIGTIKGLMESVLSGWLHEKSIDAKIIVYPDVSNRDDALESGEIDAFIGEGSSVSAKACITPLIKVKNVNMYLGVSKKRRDLLDELNFALSELDNREQYYVYKLSEKYFSASAISVHVSPNEVKWLQEHDYIIKVGYMENFLPYCGTAADGSPTGIMVDILKASFANLKVDKPIRFEYYPYESTQDMIDALHMHEIELLFPISNDIYYIEQNDLFHSEDVITSAMNFVYLDDLEEAKEKPLAINRNNEIQYEYAATHFPNATIVYFDSVDECLESVAKGEAGGAILSGLRASTLLMEADFSKLSYIELPYTTVKCFGVSTFHKGILPLINQALGTMDNDAAMTFTYKYIGHANDYSLKEFIRRHSFAIALAIFAMLSAMVVSLVLIISKHHRQKLYYQFAYKDTLTGLYNRRSYDEDLGKFSKSIPENLVCVSLDLNGLKGVNDNLGHVAGDELISEAARLIQETMGKYGRIYRTGGDEYFAILRASAEDMEDCKTILDNLCEEWKGAYSDKMRISVGIAYMSDVEDLTDVMDICKLADKRMYEAKAEYYRVNNIERRRG